MTGETISHISGLSLSFWLADWAALGLRAADVSVIQSITRSAIFRQWYRFYSRVDFPNCKLLVNKLQKRDNIPNIIENGTEGFCRSLPLPRVITQAIKNANIGTIHKILYPRTHSRRISSRAYIPQKSSILSPSTSKAVFFVGKYLILSAECPFKVTHL